MYAISTSEVRQLTGIVYERERRGQEQDPECIAKNNQFLEALQENMRFKLSECLKDKPFVALNPTAKAQIMAMLCNDLLMNKAVCRQIENSLESQASLKKEKYLLDSKIRKCKMSLTRKTRLEQYEKSIQLTTIESLNVSQIHTDTEMTDLSTKIDESIKDVSVKDDISPIEDVTNDNSHVQSENEESKIENESSVKNHNDKSELVTPATPEKSVVSERDAQTPASSVKSERPILPGKGNGINDTMNEKMDDDNSDCESEGTQLEEDENAALMVDEVQKKLEGLLQEASANKEQLLKALHGLRARCYGQDRYWRRFWHLPKTGGIFVEGLESSQPEILKYHEILEENKALADELLREQIEIQKRNKRSKRSKAKSECNDSSKSDNELPDTTVKTDGNISDSGIIQHTNKDNSSMVEEKFVQPTANQSNNDEEMDIEESIPTAILVQKSNKAGELIDPMCQVPTYNVPKSIQDVVNPPIIEKNLIDNQEKHCDTVMENGVDGKTIKSEIDSIKNENELSDVKKEPIQLMDKWFSLLKREIPLVSQEAAVNRETRRIYCNITCRDTVLGQGHRWDVGNALYFYTNPDDGKPDNPYASACVMSLSGLNEIEMQDTTERRKDVEEKKIDEDLDEDIKPDLRTEDVITGFSLPPYMALSLNNLQNYLQCDSPGPVPCTPEEQKQLEDIKMNGAPSKLENNFVLRELRHGWWKVNEIEQLNEVIQSLNPHGIRERNLRQNILAALTESIDLTIPCPVSNPRAPPPPKGFIEPDAMNAWNPQIARRVELALLDQVESLEDKIASASMQIKGWNVPTRDNDSNENSEDFVNIQSIGERILSLEAAIERRYLKPPLGVNITEAQIAAMAQKKQEEEQCKQNDSARSDTSEDDIPRGKKKYFFILMTKNNN